MTCFAIPGDMVLNAEESDCEFVNGLIAVANQIQFGAQIVRGTWTFDKNAGLALDDIFEKNPDLRVIRTIFWDFFLTVTGVIEVESVDLRVDVPSRTLFVHFVVRTDFGPLEDTLALVFP
jgi:hypothetical protein